MQDIAKGREGYIDCCPQPLTVLRTPIDRQSLYALWPKEGRDCRTTYRGAGESEHIRALQLLLDHRRRSLPLVHAYAPYLGAVLPLHSVIAFLPSTRTTKVTVTRMTAQLPPPPHSIHRPSVLPVIAAAATPPLSSPSAPQGRLCLMNAFINSGSSPPILPLDLI